MKISRTLPLFSFLTSFILSPVALAKSITYVGQGRVRAELPTPVVHGGGFLVEQGHEQTQKHENYFFRLAFDVEEMTVAFDWGMPCSGNNLESSVANLNPEDGTFHLSCQYEQTHDSSNYNATGSLSGKWDPDSKQLFITSFYKSTSGGNQAVGRSSSTWWLDQSGEVNLLPEAAH